MRRRDRLALVALVAGLALLALGFVRQHNQQQDTAKLTKNICNVQGVVYGQVLGLYGLRIEHDKIEAKHAAWQLEAFDRSELVALHMALDGLFAHPPDCGSKFNFVIQLSGEKPRHVTTK